MEFHLLYAGKLHVNGSVKEKHAIRQALHPQLRRLWMTTANLRRKAVFEGTRAHNDARMKDDSLPLSLPEDEAISKGFDAMGWNWNKNNFAYVPLVTSDVTLRCSLDILFLRAEEKSYILQGGDIDGRLKTLFDGLRMHRNASELPYGAEGDEQPFFCLLENDDLISEVRVNASQLLLLPGTQAIDPADVYLQITVRLNPTVIGWNTWIV